MFPLHQQNLMAALHASNGPRTPSAPSIPPALLAALHGPSVSAPAMPSMPNAMPVAQDGVSAE